MTVDAKECSLKVEQFVFRTFEVASLRYNHTFETPSFIPYLFSHHERMGMVTCP